MRPDKEERGQERAQVSKAVGKYEGDGVALHQADEVFEGTEGHEITGREEQRKPGHPLSSFLLEYLAIFFLGVWIQLLEEDIVSFLLLPRTRPTPTQPGNLTRTRAPTFTAHGVFIAQITDLTAV